MNNPGLAVSRAPSNHFGRVAAQSLPLFRKPLTSPNFLPMAGSAGIRQRVRWCAELLALRYHSLCPRESAQRRDGKAFVAAKGKKPGLSGIPKAALVFHSNPMRPLWYCAVGSARPDGNFPLCCQTGGGGSKLHILKYYLWEDLIACCVLLLMASKTAAAAATMVAHQRQQTEQEKGAKTSALRRMSD